MMWKSVVFASALLASSVFGAVTITAPASVAPSPVDGSFTIPIALSITGGELVAGVSIYPIPALPGGVDVTSKFSATRTMDTTPGSPGTMITDFVNSSYTNKVLTTAGVDAGGLVGDLGNPIQAGGPLMTLVIKLSNAVAPASITLQGSWVDGLTIETGGTFAPVVALTPEPISGLLLAAGALFFARRRR